MRANCVLRYHIPALIIHSSEIFIIQKGRWISSVITSWLDSFHFINEDKGTPCLLGKISEQDLNGDRTAACNSQRNGCWWR